MPSLKRIPAYRLHKPSGQARVIVDGKHVYLGAFDSPESRQNYARFIAERFSNPAPTMQPASPGIFPALSINELILRFMQFAEGYFVKNGKPTGELTNMRYSLAPLRTLYGTSAAGEFGPRSLKAVREYMTSQQRLCRGVINSRINRIRRMFKWAVSEELVSATVHQALCTVAGLRFGRSEARETEPIHPVADEVVRTTIRFLPPIVADMVMIQRLGGMRPGEVVSMRPCDLERQGDVWIYEPSDHKMQHLGHRRLIAIGPEGQRLLSPYLNRGPALHVFSPKEVMEWRVTQRQQHPRNRRTPVYPSEGRRLAEKHRLSTNRSRRRPPSDHYDVGSYRRAIQYAIRKANSLGEKIPNWHPNQLRHSRATEVRRTFGLEGAQATLGHAHADVTQIYAERDLDLAKRIAKMTG